MSEELDILHPVRQVPVGGHNIEVREMRWKPALAFVQQLGGLVGEFTEGNKLVITPEKIVSAIARSGDLASDLIRRTTDLPAEAVDNLTPTEALSLLEAAIEVNLHPDLLGKASGVGRAFERALGVKLADGAG